MIIVCVRVYNLLLIAVIIMILRLAVSKSLQPIKLSKQSKEKTVAKTTLNTNVVSEVPV